MNNTPDCWQRLARLFQVFELPTGDLPVHLAMAMPDEALTRLAGFPAAALPSSGRIASGRGRTAEMCAASALGEAVELVSCCAWGDEAVIEATEADLGPAALRPEDLNGFTEEQIGERRWFQSIYNMPGNWALSTGFTGK